jgi:hypothetical protein
MCAFSSDTSRLADSGSGVTVPSTPSSAWPLMVALSVMALVSRVRLASAT